MRDIGCRVQGAGARSHGGMRAGPNPFDLFVVLALSIMVASDGPRCEGLTTGVPRFSGLIISSVSNTLKLP